MELINDFKILVVDDDPDVLDCMQQYLEPLGHEVSIIDDGREALDLLKERDFDIVFTDLMMKAVDGMEILSTIKEYNPETEVIIITGYATIETAIEALKGGCYDYLQKPIDLERLRIITNHILEKKALQRENIFIKKKLKEKHRFDEIVGMSPSIQDIFDKIEKVSRNDFTVFIQGESGTGKGMVARVIHNRSDRKNNPFIPINCGAIAEGLLESELFGHLKGSFSGAIRDKIGLFKAAQGGTIFLDEIAEVSSQLQVKLLRVLQEKRVRPVGDTHEYDVDARVIAATNRNAKQAIKDGILREDLFYRLNVISVDMPALRERKEDIPLLVNHFINIYNTRDAGEVVRVAPEAMDILERYQWPGNVRQLENVIARAFALGVEHTIGVDDLPADIKNTDSGSRGGTLNIRENEIVLIKKALKQTGGNKADAAKLLGINTATLYRKLKRTGLDDSHYAKIV